MRWWIAGTVGLLGVGGIALAQEPIPLGGQFQVNTYTGFQQYFADVAADPQGTFVIVWQSLGGSGTDSSGWSIQAQRYDTDGIAVGGEFQVNSYTESSQGKPAVAADAQGNFVVAWQGEYADDPYSGYSGIQAQRFDASGNLVGVEFGVNSFTTHSQVFPSVGADAHGNFVVVWESRGSYGTDDSWESIQAQQYDDSGIPVGDQFQVNSFTTNNQVGSAVALDGQGEFVVVWDSRGSYGTDDSHWSIQGQRYDDNGTLEGGQFQVNTYTTSHQPSSAVAVDAQGNFVVAWQSNGSYGTDTDGHSIQAQRYDSTGASVGDQFQVNSYTTGDQLGPRAAVDAQGNFVVVWDSQGSNDTDTSGASIQGQFYRVGGTPIGGQFQINTYTTGEQVIPVVSSLDVGGNFVVVWRSIGSYGNDTSSFSVQARRFDTWTLLTDDFESGDVTAWSQSTP